MIDIRPDLRNKFTEIESAVNSGQPVYLTKNGYGTMVVMSIEQYSNLVNATETKLDEADRLSEKTDKRFSHEQVFENVRKRLEE